MGLEGIFAIHKPSNWTSFDMVHKVRNTLQRVFHEKHPKIKLKHGQIKVGHGGTLDPLATGVMVIGVGRRATRVMDVFTAGTKV
jgi:tRNA pseudouridine55 synthase